MKSLSMFDRVTVSAGIWARLSLPGPARAWRANRTRLELMPHFSAASERREVLGKPAQLKVFHFHLASEPQALLLKFQQYTCY